MKPFLGQSSFYCIGTIMSCRRGWFTLVEIGVRKDYKCHKSIIDNTVHHYKSIVHEQPSSLLIFIAIRFIFY